MINRTTPIRRENGSKNGRLRIAMLTAHSCPLGKLGAKDTGGMSVYIRELARELGKSGHSVDVYTRMHGPDEDQTVELGENARLIHLKAGNDGELDKLAIYPHLPDFAREVERFRKTHLLQYDLISSHYWLSAWVGQRLRAWWKVPHVAMFHTLGAAKNAVGIGEGDPALRIETERRLARACPRIIAATQGEKANLISYYNTPPERVSVIPCGVNLKLFQPIDKEKAKGKTNLTGKKVVLYVGRIEALKGLDQLFMAVTHLEKKDLTLLVIGGDERSRSEVERLRGLSVELGIHDLVAFPGMVEQEDLPLYYSAADVCIIPSYYESFGLVMLEALACGTPVVATDVGAAGIVIKPSKTGYIVPDNSPRHLAEKIRLVLDHPEVLADPAEIRATVTGFSWAHIATAVLYDWKQAILRQDAPRR